MFFGELVAHPNTWCDSCILTEIEVLNRFPGDKLAIFLKQNIRLTHACMNGYINIMFTFIFLLQECEKELLKQFLAVFKRCGTSQKKYIS